MLGLLVSLVVMNAVYECYLTESIFAQNNGICAATPTWQGWAAISSGTTWVSSPFWSGESSAGCALGVHALACLLRRSSLKAGLQTGVPKDALRRPLLPVTIPFPAVVLACNCAVMVLMMGVNIGNDVLYYHQLISPFLLWLAFVLANRKGQWRAACLIVLLANIVWFGRPAGFRGQRTTPPNGRRQTGSSLRTSGCLRLRNCRTCSHGTE